MSATAAGAMVTRFVRSEKVAPPAVEIAPGAEHGSRGLTERTRLAATNAVNPLAPTPLPSTIPEAPIPSPALASEEGVHKVVRSPSATKQTRAKVRPPLAGLVEGDARSGPGAALVIGAMEARRVGDLNRAAYLLSEYQRKYPDGALQEEALALSIEAAASRGNDAAPGLAAQYLARYPHGRFREQARRALKSLIR